MPTPANRHAAAGNHGNYAAPALPTSAANPAVFLPIVVDGRAFIDGGIASNTPIAAAFALGAPRRHRGPNPA